MVGWYLVHYTTTPPYCNMLEKVCLQWNDFQENVKSMLGNLREENDFTDVTLACDDGQQVEAHKVILAASSPFFKKLLGRNKHAPHTLIYMREMKYDDLLAIVDFVYRGESNVYQENLDSFLAIAAELQLIVDKIEIDEKPILNTAGAKMAKKGPENSSSKVLGAEENKIPVSHFSGNLQQLEERIKSMMKKSQNNYQNQNRKADICKVCGKEGMSNAIKDHIEAHHLEGIVIPCNMCGKTFKSRNSFRPHKRQHQNELI